MRVPLSGSSNRVLHGESEERDSQQSWECHGSGIRGWTGELAKFWDKFIVYKKRAKGEVMVCDVRGVEEGAVDYGTRGRYDPPKLWFHCTSSCSVCCVRAMGDRGRHERGGAKRG